MADKVFIRAGREGKKRTKAKKLTVIIGDRGEKMQEIHFLSMHCGRKLLKMGSYRGEFKGN